MHRVITTQRRVRASVHRAETKEPHMKQTGQGLAVTCNPLSNTVKKWISLFLAVALGMTLLSPSLAFATEVDEASEGNSLDALETREARAETELTPLAWDDDIDNAAVLYISNDAELQELAQYVNEGEDFEGKTIYLTEDINLSEIENWHPIGNGAQNGSGYTGNAFKGTFDGNNKSVTGLTIDVPSAPNAKNAYGLFGVVDGGVVKNLTLKTVHVSVGNGEVVGGAIGLLVGGGSAEGITVGASSDGSFVKALRGNGGIVGRMTLQGSITNCTNYAAIEGSGANIGGIVGAAYYTQAGTEMNIANCFNYGTVTGTSTSASSVGGIAGFSTANISGCSNTGIISTDITTGTCSAGGIVGEQQVYGTVSGNTNTASVTGSLSGGIIGWLRYASYTGASGPANYGCAEVIEVIDNYNSGRVTGGSSSNFAAAGGIVGIAQDYAFIYGNKNYSPALTSYSFVGGIAGSLRLDSSYPQNLSDYAGPIIQVFDNLTTTPCESLSTSGGLACVDLFAWNNRKDHFAVFDNYTTETSDLATADAIVALINTLLDSYDSLDKGFQRTVVNGTVCSITRVDPSILSTLATAENRALIAELEQLYIANNNDPAMFELQETTCSIDDALYSDASGALIKGSVAVTGAALSLPAPTSADWVTTGDSNQIQMSFTTPDFNLEDHSIPVALEENSPLFLFDLSLKAIPDPDSALEQPIIPLYVSFVLSGDYFSAVDPANLVIVNYHFDYETQSIVGRQVPLLSVEKNEEGNYEVTAVFSQLSTVLVGVKSTGTDPVNPSNPGAPGNPQLPSQPSAPGLENSLAKTGDSLGPLVTVAVVVLVLLALVLIIIARRAQKTQNKHATMQTGSTLSLENDSCSLESSPTVEHREVK